MGTSKRDEFETAGKNSYAIHTKPMRLLAGLDDDDGNTIPGATPQPFTCDMMSRMPIDIQVSEP